MEHSSRNPMKWKCSDCDSIFLDADFLEAKNPFDAKLTIYGCPICKNVAGFTEICDEPGCDWEATCGFSTAKGYRRTCGKHFDFDALPDIKAG